MNTKDKSSKELQELKASLGPLEEYFEQDFKDLEAEYAKSKEYSAIIDNQIDQLQQMINEGNVRGAQHYLTEYISSVADLQSQRQSIIKDRVSMKLNILNLHNKKQEANGDNGKQLTDLLQNFINQNNNNNNTSVKETKQNEADIDDELEAFYNSKINNQENIEEEIEQDNQIEEIKTQQPQNDNKENKPKLSNSERLKQINDMLSNK